MGADAGARTPSSFQWRWNYFQSCWIKIWIKIREFIMPKNRFQHTVQDTENGPPQCSVHMRQQDKGVYCKGHDCEGARPQKIQQTPHNLMSKTISKKKLFMSTALCMPQSQQVESQWNSNRFGTKMEGQTLYQSDSTPGTQICGLFGRKSRHAAVGQVVSADKVDSYWLWMNDDQHMRYDANKIDSDIFVYKSYMIIT